MCGTGRVPPSPGVNEMHEYSIVRALLDRVHASARDHGATAVHRLRVRVGELSGVEPELLSSAYELVRGNGLCAGAELELVSAPARWSCPGCGRDIDRGAALSCPECALPARLEGGDEILLERIEMEVA